MQYVGTIEVAVATSGRAGARAAVATLWTPTDSVAARKLRASSSAHAPIYWPRSADRARLAERLACCLAASLAAATIGACIGMTGWRALIGA